MSLKSELKNSSRQGTTLVEVMLAGVVLGILAVVGIGALFYPRYLVTAYAGKRAALHAGSHHLEEQFAKSPSMLTDALIDFPEIYEDYYNPGGKDFNGETEITLLENQVFDGQTYEVFLLETHVNYRDADEPVSLITLRRRRGN